MQRMHEHIMCVSVGDTLFETVDQELALASIAIFLKFKIIEVYKRYFISLM